MLDNPWTMRVNIMADRLANSGLLQAFGDLIGDLSDLLQKEIRLAKAEVADKITAKLQAGGWMLAAGILGLLAAALIVQAAVFAVASFGFALHWACLIVAAALVIVAAAAFYHGRSLAEEDLTPHRALGQVAQDIKTAKEQLT
jgi:putative superfamily III holin-X